MKNQSINEMLFANILGVKVYWDEDHDERIIKLVEDAVPELEYLFGYNNLIAVSEHEGCLDIIMDSLSFPVKNIDNKLQETLVAQLFEEIVSWTLHDSWAILVQFVNIGYQHYEQGENIMNSFRHIDAVLDTYSNLREWYHTRLTINPIIPLKDKIEQLNKEKRMLTERIIQLQNELGRPS